MTTESSASGQRRAVESRRELAGSGRYQVLRRVGEGGMGVVYEAFDRQRRERVALKTLRYFDAGALDRFKHEFRTLADVVHPNLVHLHELVADAWDDVFFSMELVEGTDFLTYVSKPEARSGVTRSLPTVAPPARIGRGGAAPRIEAAHFDRRPSPAVDFNKLRPALRQLVEGVAALHAAGKLHRDLKPSNVRVTPDGRVVILDFGVATELLGQQPSRGPGDQREVVGTTAYMAPEQALGDPPLAAADWYGVGAILYEAIVGAPPHVGAGLDVLAMKCTLDPSPPSEHVQGVPDDLDSLCFDLLSIDPNQRPTTDDILRRVGVTSSDRAPPLRVETGLSVRDLVGRDEHLRLLEHGFERTREGRAVWMRVAGASGVGKSAVVHHFLDGLEKNGGVVALRGRAYERESVPYKAFDSIVDALSRHLRDLEDRKQALELPAHVGALAQVFPVLRRVRSIETIAHSKVDDPRVVRQRAFTAMRELFGWLTNRTPVVVFIDDVHWGDIDSAALLLDLLRPTGEPPLLLLTTHRASDAEASPFLAHLRARWMEDVEVRDVDVGPLRPPDARALALALLGNDSPDAAQSADGIARESRGSPFLLEELARAASQRRSVPAAANVSSSAALLTLEQIVGDRIARLPDDARRILQIVALGGRPLSITVVREAASVGDAAPRLIAFLRARRLVRAGLRDGVETVEVSHDRIRETIAAQLPLETAREHHGHLARALEAAPDSDPEAIAVHLLGVGDRERAGNFAEKAAEQAIGKLAFAQAARLYELALETRSGSDVQRLRRRMAEASEWAGHAAAAARAYLAAADGASALDRLDLERAACAQLIAAGMIDEGVARFRQLLAAVGRAVPRSQFSILFWVVIYRAIGTCLMLTRTRDQAELEPEIRVRLDLLLAIGRALGVLEPLSALYVKARYLVDAWRSGSRFHVVRAAAAEAGAIGGTGKHPGRRERLLFKIARRLADKSNDQEGLGLYEITFGICQYLRGEWRSCVDLMDVAHGRLAALRRWQANASVYGVYALTWMGNLPEVGLRTKRLLADAERRGDLYTAVNLRASHPIAVWLAADNVDAARRHLKESIGAWSKTSFLIQHWQYMLWEAEAHLYLGEGEEAHERLARDESRLRQSRYLRYQLVRAFTLFARGRSAVARALVLEGAQRKTHLACARRACRCLKRERMVWIDALAALLCASVAKASGDDRTAERELHRAIVFSTAVDMGLHAAAARHRLGLLIGGHPGASLVREAEDAMRARSVRMPARYAGMLVPGKWSPEEAKSR